MIVDEKYLLDQQKEEIEFLAKDRDRYKELFNQAVKNRDEFAACCDTYIKQRQVASVNYQNLENMNKLLQKQVDELTKELANERNAVITFQESANAHRLKVGEVMQQNAELQKQIDELKSALSDTIKRNEELIEENEQSVKGTAKDIISLLEDMDKRGMTLPFNMVLRQLKKRCGVEVE